MVFITKLLRNDSTNIDLALKIHTTLNLHPSTTNPNFIKAFNGKKTLAGSASEYVNMKPFISLCLWTVLMTVSNRLTFYYSVNRRNKNAFINCQLPNSYELILIPPYCFTSASLLDVKKQQKTMV